MHLNRKYLASQTPSNSSLTLLGSWEDPVAGLRSDQASCAAGTRSFDTFSRVRTILRELVR